MKFRTRNVHKVEDDLIIYYLVDFSILRWRGMFSNFLYSGFYPRLIDFHLQFLKLGWMIYILLFLLFCHVRTFFLCLWNPRMYFLQINVQFLHFVVLSLWFLYWAWFRLVKLLFRFLILLEFHVLFWCPDFVEVRLFVLERSIVVCIWYTLGATVFTEWLLLIFTFLTWAVW